MSREEKLARVPLEARLDIVAMGLTGAVNAFGLALEQALGKERYMQFACEFWKTAGKQSKQIVDAFQFPVDNVKEFSETLSCVGTLALGPGYQSDVYETGGSLCKGRTKKCPIHDRLVEAGLADNSYCVETHEKFVEGLLEALGLDYRFSISNGMATGGASCEWMVEK